MEDKFKDRYVLGEGYPWAYGMPPYNTMGLLTESLISRPIDLEWSDELWSKDVPKFRLVLEKILE